jgi:hypothetical protein
MLKRLLFFSLLSLFAVSCIKEDMDNCQRGLRLQFRYIHNNQNTDLLSEQVRNILVYVFDQNTDVLVNVIPVGIQDIARGYMDVNVASGLYTVLAWGGSSTDMLQGGYRDATATNPAANTYAPITIGTTTLDEFRMMLTYDPLSGNTLADVAPKITNFDDLFYAGAESVSVVGNSRQTVDLAFIKNTSVLKVVVSGLQHLRSTMPLEIFTTGKNWLYEYNNAPDMYTPRMLYMPQTETLTANTMEVSIKQQRLNISQMAVDPVILYFRDPVNNTDIIAPLNLIEDIRQNPAYQTQAAIDAEDLFIIDISIQSVGSGLTVTITINDWQIVHLTPITDR